MKSTWTKMKGPLKIFPLTLLFIFFFISSGNPEAEIMDSELKGAKQSTFKPDDFLSKTTTLPSIEPAFAFRSLDFSSSANFSAPLPANSFLNSVYFQEAHHQIKSKVLSLLNNQRFRRTQFSISIRWAGTGEAIFEHQAHRPLIPASNMKLVTSAAALHFLSPDFEFKTVVGLVGQSLVIIGSGDPLFGDREIDKQHRQKPNWLLEDISSRLSFKGIKSIQDIILDTSIFDDQRVHPSWPENSLLQKYACEVSGLNYNSNCVNLSVINRQGKTFLLLEPETSYLRLINETVATKSAENWFSVSRGASPLTLRVTGKVKTQAGPYAIAVANPALFFGTILKEHLIKRE